MTFCPGMRPWVKPGRFFFLLDFPSQLSSSVARDASKTTCGGGAEDIVPVLSQTTDFKFCNATKLTQIINILIK